MNKYVLENVKSIEYDKNKTKIFGIKSAILWGHTEKNGSFPLVYILKPKHISQEDYDLILDRLQISLLKK